MNSQQSNDGLGPQATNLVSPVLNSDTDRVQYSPGREPVYTILGCPQSQLQTMSQDLTFNQPQQQPTHTPNYSNEPPWVRALFYKIDLTHTEVVTINKRVSTLESEIKSLHRLNEEMSDIKESLNFVCNQYDTLKEEITQTREKIKQNRSIITEQANQINTLKEQALIDQGRSMRNNLVFSGIAEGDTQEDSEHIVRNFIKEKMKVNSDNIEIKRAHRESPRRQGKSHLIVAKFLRFKL